MLYCSIEDAWGPLPVNKQIESYKNSQNKGLEHFQNSIRKKVSKKNKPGKKKKIIRKKRIIRETFDDDDSEDEKCYDEESEPETSEYNSEELSIRSENSEEEYDEEVEEYQEEETEDMHQDSKENIWKKKINKLLKENKSLKSKIRKLQRNSPLFSSDILNNLVTDKNREIIVMSLIGLMIIIVFHLLLRSTK